MQKLKKIEVGDKFQPPQNKRKDVYTVIDILTTRNLKDEIVDCKILAEHTFMGQKVQKVFPRATVKRYRK